MAGRFLLPPMYVFPETGDRKYQKSNDKIVIIMKGILETVASVVERLSLSSAEKKRLKQELETALLENECQRVEMQARVVGDMKTRSLAMEEGAHLLGRTEIG